MEASERHSQGRPNPYIPVRVRWFDDEVGELAQAGGQVVLLGAGLDTRPYRLDLPADLDWYELDRAEIFADKEPVLAGETPHCRRHLVVGDVAGDWADALLTAGFTPSRPTLWVAEGLLYYLNETSTQAMLRTARALGGGVLLADLFPAAIVERVAAMNVQRPAPPPFGSDDPDGLFARGGWRVAQITAPGGPGANFDRYPGLPAGRQIGHAQLIRAVSTVD
jgi:methyltransferase (TIGR00027 family)